MSLRLLQAIRPGAVSFCATASEPVDKVLELKQQHFGNIALKDGVGRTIDLDELSQLCEAGRDRK